MKPEARSFFAKADRAIRAAEALLESGVPDFSVGRSYYAMFYAARPSWANAACVTASTAACMVRSPSTSSPPA
jgi:hypothetical protein